MHLIQRSRLVSYTISDDATPFGGSRGQRWSGRFVPGGAVFVEVAPPSRARDGTERGHTAGD
ncbi:hypothetical protein ZHAS_00020506 [Anopheles sinensis]|uniref:Uncharacterized protein n=1 Tax=Anopheles sinensis TaxID=74873 RepID=A0A084WQ14_ANOSI|nr:hypothetical protein ZHAS_00020506 [Anopheles sinensis]